MSDRPPVDPGNDNDRGPETKPAPTGERENENDAPARPCDPACREQLLVFRAGLTDGEEPIGVALVSDAVDELTSVCLMISPSEELGNLSPILVGITRRLNAALKILRLEVP